MKSMKNVFTMNRWMQVWDRIHGRFLVTVLLPLCFVSLAGASIAMEVPSPTEPVLDDGSIYRFSLLSNDTGAQDFVVRSAGNGHYTLTNKTSGKCLDIYDGQSSNGAKLLQRDCQGGGNQKFLAEWAEDGIRFKSAHSGLCLAAPTAKSDNAVSIQQSVCREGQKNQIWIPDPRILSWTEKAKQSAPVQTQRLKYPAFVGILTRF